MLFGDEKRFGKTLVNSSRDPQVLPIKPPSTEQHLGPGSYFTNDQEDVRNGWKKKQFSKREPMTPTRSDLSIFSRQDHYTHGVMTSYGAISVPVYSPKKDSPGPGAYDRDILKTPRGLNVSLFLILFFSSKDIY
jgi:hypothetical protein